MPRCWYAIETQKSDHARALYRFATREERDAFVNGKRHDAHGAAFPDPSASFYHECAASGEARSEFPRAFTDSARVGLSMRGEWFPLWNGADGSPERPSGWVWLEA